MPKPRKLRLDSIRIADATPNVAVTMIGPSEFGSKCRTMTRKSLAPSAWAACGNGCPPRRKNSPRTNRATPVQPVSPITTMMMIMLFAASERLTTTRMSSSVGKHSITSINRHVTISTQRR